MNKSIFMLIKSNWSALSIKHLIMKKINLKVQLQDIELLIKNSTTKALFCDNLPARSWGKNYIKLENVHLPMANYLTSK